MNTVCFKQAGIVYSLGINFFTVNGNIVENKIIDVSAGYFDKFILSVKNLFPAVIDVFKTDSLIIAHFFVSVVPKKVPAR